MDNTFVNIFNGVLDKDTSKKMSVLDILWKISGGEWKTRISQYRLETDKKRKEELKKQLPAVTFSGTLDGGGRFDKDVKNYTGIVVCDIDKVSESKVSSYKKTLSEDGYVLAFFESPSKGLKVLVRANSDLEYHKSHAFRQIEDYMMVHYGIKIDPSGKNPSRLCFISHDEDMYFNDSAQIFPVDVSIDYEEIEKEEMMESVRNRNENFEISNDSGHVFETCVKWVKKSKVGSYHKGNRNNYVFALSCHLNRAGMSQDLALQMVLGRYPSLGFNEAKTTVGSAYKHNSNEHGSKPIYSKKTNQNELF